MAFVQLFDEASSTYTYLIADEGSHEAVIIDPVIDQSGRDRGLLASRGLNLVYTLETHVHADHLTGANALKSATGARTAVSRDCNAQGYDRLLEDAEVVLFGNQQILVIGTPGHTPGSVCFLWEDRLFTGDTLLINGCGRTDFQNGSAEALWDSVTRKLFTLDPQTLVYPAHDYKGRRVSTIGEEAAFNPRFAGVTRGQFLHLMANLNLAMPKRIHEAVPANLDGGPNQTQHSNGKDSNMTEKQAGDVLNVSPGQYAELVKSGQPILLDVRTPAEFNAVRVPGALNVPLDSLDPVELEKRFTARAPLYIICQTGMRSQLAAQRLREAGFQPVIHVDGGTNAWSAAGLPVERGGPAPSVVRS